MGRFGVKSDLVHRRVRGIFPTFLRPCVIGDDSLAMRHVLQSMVSRSLLNACLVMLVAVSMVVTMFSLDSVRCICSARMPQHAEKG